MYPLQNITGGQLARTYVESNTFFSPPGTWHPVLSWYSGPDVGPSRFAPCSHLVVQNYDQPYAALRRNRWRPEAHLWHHDPLLYHVGHTYLQKLLLQTYTWYSRIELHSHSLPRVENMCAAVTKPAIHMDSG